MCDEGESKGDDGLSLVIAFGISEALGGGLSGLT